MTSARVFYGLVAAVMVTGVATTFVPAIEDLVVTGWIVAAVLGVTVAVAAHVAAEVRWHREMHRVIHAPAATVAIDEVAAR